jgi:hypothetical protein
MHIAIAQTIFLLLLRLFLDLPFRRVFRKEAVVAVETDTHVDRRERKAAVEEVDSEPEREVVVVKKRRSQPRSAVPEHPLYSNELLDSTLAKFLVYASPSSLGKLPADVRPLEISMPLSKWNRLYHDSDSPNGLTILTHPVATHLYAISTRFPGVQTRQLWEALADIDRRPEWDTTCDQAKIIERLDKKATRGRTAVVSYVAMKGMFPVRGTVQVCLSS